MGKPKQNEDDYILGYWYAESSNNDSCYMMINREEENKYVGEICYQYSSNKNCQKFKYRGSENEVVEKANMIFDTIKVKYNNFSDHFIVKGNFDKFMELAKDKPYLSIRETTGE